MLPDQFSDFMKGPAVMLGLKRHMNRYEYSKQKLAEVGFTDVKFFEGVDGFKEDLGKVCTELNVKIQADIFKNQRGPTGFTLSCIKIWKKIVDERLPYLIIFEDDALPDPRFRQIAKRWYDKTPKNIDLMYMGSQCNPEKDDVGQDVIKNACFCTHAYVITQKGAATLMKLVEVASKGEGVDKGDCALIQWMWKKQLDWRIWNNQVKDYKIPFPVLAPTDAKADAVFHHRDNGLIFQNAFLGSTIHALHVVK
jgi:GR25 family glycosyltransferase involved in LPS biosynthesis